MTPLEKKRLEVELGQVGSARESMELKIMERQDEISRLNQSIEIQKKREEELKQKISEG